MSGAHTGHACYAAPLESQKVLAASTATVLLGLIAVLAMILARGMSDR